MQRSNLTAILTAVEAGSVDRLLITRPFESGHPLQGGHGGARLVRLTTAARPASDQVAYNEIVLLTNVLLNDSLLSQAATLRPDDFTLSAHRLIFRRMRELHDSGKPIDMLTVIERLSAHNELEQAGGCAYLSQLLEGVVERSNIAPYVDVRAYAGNRQPAYPPLQRDGSSDRRLDSAAVPRSHPERPFVSVPDPRSRFDLLAGVGPATEE
jgi:hypothetical protein